MGAITAWPPYRLPDLPVGKGVYVLVDGTVQAWPEPRGKPQPLPAETYLRELLDVDTATPQDVVEFLNEFGMVESPDGSTPWQQMTSQLGAPASSGGPSITISDQSGHVVGSWHDQSDPAVAGLIQAVRTSDALVVDYDPEYLRRKVAIAQGLVRYWLWTQRALHIAPLKVWEQAGIPCANDEEAHAIFQREFERGLQVFRPRVGLDPVRPDVTLFPALCAQLFNAIEEGLPVRVCANERCGRFFIRQRGRSSGEITRTKGTLYCSRSCGQAQKQREYSARKRQQ